MPARTIERELPQGSISQDPYGDIIIYEDDGSHSHVAVIKKAGFQWDHVEAEWKSLSILERDLFMMDEYRIARPRCTNHVCPHSRNFAGRPTAAARNNSSNNQNQTQNQTPVPNQNQNLGSNTTQIQPQSQSQNQNQNHASMRTNTTTPSAYNHPSLAPPTIAAAPASPSLLATMSTNDQAYQNNVQAPQAPTRAPFFFREQYTGFIVKGNFMTLAAKPQNVEEGEWMAHQVAEQNRVLEGMIKILEKVDRVRGTGICNEQGCPTMNAGSVTYTWIDTSRNPINLPAPTYMSNIQTWVRGKIQDPTLFPTDSFTTAPQIPTPTQQASDPNYYLGQPSGFPQRFEAEIKNMYKQMFRCYAHLYWQHWLDFWHLNVNRELNTCFIHFINVGRLFGLLADKDAEPMLPLVELWIRAGALTSTGLGGHVPQAPGMGEVASSSAIASSSSVVS